MPLVDQPPGAPPQTLPAAREQAQDGHHQERQRRPAQPQDGEQQPAHQDLAPLVDPGEQLAATGFE
jgi:hypothetical protein